MENPGCVKRSSPGYNIKDAPLLLESVNTLLGHAHMCHCEVNAVLCMIFKGIEHVVLCHVHNSALLGGCNPCFVDGYRSKGHIQYID